MRVLRTDTPCRSGEVLTFIHIAKTFIQSYLQMKIKQASNEKYFERLCILLSMFTTIPLLLYHRVRVGSEGNVPLLAISVVFFCITQRAG